MSPYKQPKENTRRVVFWVNSKGSGVEGVEIVVDGLSAGKTNSDGYIEFWVDPKTGGFDLELHRTSDILKIRDFPIDDDMTVYFDTEKKVAPHGIAPDIQVMHENFYTYPDQKLHRLQGVTFFTDFLKFLQNDRNEVNNDKLRQLGVNTKRIFGCTYYVGDLNPYQWPDYFEKLDKYLAYQREEGFNIIFVAIARDGNIPPDLASCQDFTRRCSDVTAKYGHTLYGIANEPYQNLPSGVTAQELAYSIATGNYSENGAAPEPKAPYQPVLDWSSEHTPRDSEWERKFRHIQESREMTKKPSVSGEPMGAGNDFIAGKQDNSPQKFLEYFAGAAMYGGGVFHSVKLKTADFPDSIEFECLKAAARGWSYVPTKFLEGNFKYFFEDFSQGVPALKFYGVELGNEGICCLTRRNHGVPLVPISGWKIVEGPIEDCVIYLERE